MAKRQLLQGVFCTKGISKTPRSYPVSFSSENQSKKLCFKIFTFDTQINVPNPNRLPLKELESKNDPAQQERKDIYRVLVTRQGSLHVSFHELLATIWDFSYIRREKWVWGCLGLQNPNMALKPSISFLHQEAMEPYLFVLHETLHVWNSFVGPVCYPNHTRNGRRRPKVPGYILPRSGSQFYAQGKWGSVVHSCAQRAEPN